MWYDMKIIPKYITIIIQPLNSKTYSNSIYYQKVSLAKVNYKLTPYLIADMIHIEKIITSSTSVNYMHIVLKGTNYWKKIIIDVTDVSRWNLVFAHSFFVLQWINYYLLGNVKCLQRRVYLLAPPIVLKK